MAQLDDVREGLAANLYALKTNRTVGHVSAYLQENPQTPSLHVIGVDEFEYGMGYGSAGQEWLVLVEAVIGRATDIGAQKTLNALIATEGAASLKQAVETDRKLTSRLGDNGRVTTGQPAACSDLLLNRYRGQTRLTIAGADLLIATWDVRVIA